VCDDRGVKFVGDKSSVELGAAEYKRAAVEFLRLTVDVAHLTQHFLVQRQLLGT